MGALPVARCDLTSARTVVVTRRGALAQAAIWPLGAYAATACRATESKREVVTTLTWLVPGNPRNETEAKQALLARFNDQNPDIVAKPQVEEPRDYATKLEALIEAGVEPDVLTIDGVLLPKLANRNALFDLVRLARVEGRGGNTFLDQYQPQYLEASRRDARLFGLPVAARQAVLYVNKTIFQGAGVPLPPVEWEDPSWTWTNFLARAHAVTRVSGNQRMSQAGVLMTGRHLMWMAWILQNGGRLFNRTLTRSLLDQPEVIDAIQWLANLIHKEFVAPLPSDWSNFTFQKGNVAMHVDFTSQFAWFAGQIKNTFQWDIYPLPHEKQLGTYAEWNYYAVSARTTAPDKAWRLAKFLASPEGDGAQLQSGISTPILRGTEPLFLDDNPIAAGKNRGVGAAAPGIPMLPRPFIEWWPQVLNILSTEFSRVWNNQTRAYYACRNVKPIVDAVLETGLPPAPSPVPGGPEPAPAPAPVPAESGPAAGEGG